MMGPIIRPMLDETVQAKMTQIRPRELNMSSMLPPMMVYGIAESSPATTRRMMIAGKEWASPTNMQQILLSSALIIYILLRPKDSENGGNTIVPTTWPSKNLPKHQMNSHY